MHADNIFASVPTSGQVSGVIALRQATRGVGIWVPTIDSCTLQLLGSWDQTSANFVPVQAALPNSGTAQFATDVGSKYVTLGAIGEDLPPFIKLKLGVAMSNPASFALVVRF